LCTFRKEEFIRKPHAGGIPESKTWMYADEQRSIRERQGGLMSIARRVKDYLERNGVPYSHCTHRLAYTAQEVAAAPHVPGREVAKTVILKTDSQFAMVVLPAVMKVNIKALREELPFVHIELATEKEFAELFPDSELGAMAPFGNLYGLP